MPVSIILDCLDCRWSVDEIVDEYPFLDRAIVEEVARRRRDVERYVKALDVVWIHPSMAFGKPVVYGTRLPISHLYDRLDAGDTVEDLARDYGFLTCDELRTLVEHRDIIEPFVREVEKELEREGLAALAGKVAS